MLNIISNANKIENGTSYPWNSLKTKQNINDGNRHCFLNVALGLDVSVFGDSDLICDTLGINGFFLNFERNTDKILVSPVFSGGRDSEILLKFSKPVHAAGVQIGVIHDDSPRSFLAKITVVDKDGNEQSSQPISGKTTDELDNTALFLGAVCNGDETTPEVSSIKLSVKRDGDSPRFEKFAIGSLVFMVNHLR
jgi:hypothetical protein